MITRYPIAGRFRRWGEGYLLRHHRFRIRIWLGSYRSRSDCWPVFDRFLFYRNLFRMHWGRDPRVDARDRLGRFFWVKCGPSIEAYPK